MTTPALVVDEEAVFDTPLDGLLGCLHYLCRRDRKEQIKLDKVLYVCNIWLQMELLKMHFLWFVRHLDKVNSPSTHLQNFPGVSLTSISLTGSVSGPRISTGRGEVHSTFWTRWYARLTQSNTRNTAVNQTSSSVNVFKVWCFV